MAQATPPWQWWQAMDRRTFSKGALAFAALLSLNGCSREEEISAEALAVQQQHGWNVGAESSRLFFLGATGHDATGSEQWRRYTDPTRLLAAWRPRTETWQPFMLPTLVQALQASSLRQQVRPVFTSAMAEAFARGETLRRDLLSQVTRGRETFFIADLPGPEAVAFGAGLAGWADLILGFDNWPHPYGVVRSHETLGALLYYAAYVEQQQANLPPEAPGLMLLDNQRLSPYTDDGRQFDNRYLASIPRAPALQQRGIKHVLYIVPDRSQKEESDDINDEFVEYREAGLQVAMLPLSDLRRVVQTVTREGPDGTPRPAREVHYYYGGDLQSHLAFLLLYSFLAPRPTASYYPGYGEPITLGRTSPPPFRPPRYQPRPRPTVFSGTRVGGRPGVGRRKPSGFGRVTVRTSGGRVTGLGRGRLGTTARRGRVPFGRSGSFGRGWSFGG
ncbi:MAG: hypothetical protein KatS3mg131_3345 [Candidatus Tectimicrobiota bacterium]|nr:MAG: hypothetical protein KatS3mg131_3345 [Candidatus Tectomicrobia bacterium]